MATLTITKRYFFESAHYLPNAPEGHKCAHMHGHNYKVDITIAAVGLYSPEFLKRGWVLDFFDLDRVMLPVIKPLDHKILNDTITNPTAENIAAYIAANLLMSLPADVTCTEVVVFETDHCWATYRPYAQSALTQEQK